MSLNKWKAQGKILCHSHQGIINGIISMWMELATYLSNNSCTFLVWLL
nr:hypothetical protein Iba_chr10aCG7460 [Ipomoea batatas]GMD45117.1 hypothetical protein Iba_chr10dCG6940 [Ipomoea batatas]GMD46612.1 hypothetical protein Iba_chr10eCG4970 [Ipomoea batatas]